MANILALTRHTRQAASSRLRHFDLIPYLEDYGHTVSVQSLLDDKYLAGLYGEQPKASMAYISRKYIDRVRWLRSGDPNSVLWIEKELFPYLPFYAESLALKGFARSILDLDDAWFLRYERLNPRLGLKSMSQKYSKLLSSVDIVTVPNSFLAEAVLARGAKQVKIIPPFIDAERYSYTQRSNAPGKPPVIGWIGSPLNARKYLSPWVDLLNKIVAEKVADIVLIGAGDEVPHLNARRLDWSEETEVAQINEIDIGIMPIEDCEWDRCKSGYKLVQCMISGKPVIASAIGFNRVLVEHSVNGYLVENTTHAWETAIRRMAASRDIIQTMGVNARQSIIKRFSDRRVGLDILLDLVE
ncbi:glycosyltransferase family 4 protein [Ahrensia sp. 13_GOM-1096m]|uniref:glycosyltransferase family 4 protein n=1 Tax=Ahrensia sp. 13_GOM-1096m TaxID=1380380 RepID=UPI000687C9D0|nr:glycosyltransferase family 4 protein [Ahrensia sp. 13_GOM-1096m]